MIHIVKTGWKLLTEKTYCGMRIEDCKEFTTYKHRDYGTCPKCLEKVRKIEAMRE